MAFSQRKCLSSALWMIILLAYLDIVVGAQAYSSESKDGTDKIRLTEISALTFYAGRQTTGRRSSPVPQMQCVGGSAGCGQYTPQVVQCYNKGSDGVDVQWECKADLDNRVKMGAIEVVCEGYDYANDPYILRGSCGLEYQLNIKTGSGSAGLGGQDTWQQTKKHGFMMSDLLIVAIVAVIVYALYKTCLQTPQYSTTNSDQPDSRPGGSYPSAPPPPYSTGFGGFSSPDYSGADCHGSSQYQSGRNSSRHGGGTNFWTGAATGGILGYLFGSRNQGGSYGSSRHHGYTSERNSNWGFGSGGGSSGGFSGGGTSSSSSFGGTRRR